MVSPKTLITRSAIVFCLLLAACTPARGGGGGGGGGGNNNGGNNDTGAGAIGCPSSDEFDPSDVFILPDVESGDFVQILVDTVSAATTFDPDLEVYGDPDLTEFVDSADDSVDCTFPPPEFSCPLVEFESEGGNLYLVVGIADSEPCAGRTVNYSLEISVNGQTVDDAELIRDDWNFNDDSTSTDDTEDSM